MVSAWVVVTGGSNFANPDVINVVNPSFENTAGNIVFNEFTFGPPPGWQIYDPNSNVVNNGVGPQFWIGTLLPNAPNFFINGAPHGQRVAIPFNFAGTGNQGPYGFQQTLSAQLQPNLRYRLQVEIGNIASSTTMNGQFFNLDGFPGYRVDLLAGGVVIASDNNSLAGQIGEGQWETSTIVFDVSATHPQMGQPLGIRLVNLNIVDAAFPTADLEVDFDDVRLTTIPLDSGTLSYGAGTPGCAGTHTLGVTQPPVINSPNFRITCDNPPAFSTGLGIVTDSQDLPGSDAFGVGVLIHSDFSIATEVLVFDFSSNGVGYSETVGTAIPNQPLLVGQTYYACALWAWPTSTCVLPGFNPFNLSTSRGLAITILAP